MLGRYNDWGLYGFDREMDRMLSDFDVLRREMNRLFEGNGGRRMRAGGAGWPRLAVFDQGENLLVRAEVPGLTEEQLNVTLDQGVLTLRGQRKVQPPEGYSVHRQERSDYEFARSLTLPCKVDGENIRAELADGVLTLTLPKAPEEQPRQIPVRGS